MTEIYDDCGRFSEWCRLRPLQASLCIHELQIEYKNLKNENAELRRVLGSAKAWLKLEGYKATSAGIREIDAVLKPKP
jgi:hypothetical protein